MKIVLSDFFKMDKVKDTKVLKILVEMQKVLKGDK